MKSLFIKMTAIFLVLVMSVSSADFAVSEVKADEAVTTEANATGEDFLKEVIGEYVPLFIGGIFNSEYDHYWHDYSAAVAGESMADMCTAILKKAIGATTYGDEAGEDFFCGYTADVAKIAFGGNDGSKVTFIKNNGEKITHDYVFVKNASATGIVEGQEMGYDGYLYKSKDDNKDEFAYIFMCPDTPKETYHLEFRYGSSEEDILKLTEGKYKNWLAAGFPASAFEDPKETLIQQVIGLFVYENLVAMSGEESNAQRANISGTWDMDTTAFKDYPGYENASMYIELAGTGTGRSFVDMTGSGNYMLASEYPFYTYGTKDTAGVEKGVYLVISEDEGLKTATYEISEKDGQKVLTFKSSEGVLTYFGRDTIAAPKITKAKVKSSKKISLKWTKVENAEGYELVYSSKSSFKKARTKTVTGKNSAKTKKLKSKTYYVKVRAFTTDDAGNKVYGDFSDVKTVIVK